MGLYDLMVEASKIKSVKLLLLQIPREVMEQQAATNGDVRFFELAYLEAEIKHIKKLSYQGDRECLDAAGRLGREEREAWRYARINQTVFDSVKPKSLQEIVETEVAGPMLG
jgi:hypothetical protein